MKKTIVAALTLTQILSCQPAPANILDEILKSGPKETGIQLTEQDQIILDVLKKAAPEVYITEAHIALTRYIHQSLYPELEYIEFLARCINDGLYLDDKGKVYFGPDRNSGKDTKLFQAYANYNHLIYAMRAGLDYSAGAKARQRKDEIKRQIREAIISLPERDIEEIVKEAYKLLNRKGE